MKRFYLLTILAGMGSLLFLGGCANSNSKTATASELPQPAKSSVNEDMPVAEPMPTSSPEPVVSQGPVITYMVQERDSLWRIANRHQTSVKKIREMNGLSSDLLHPGQKLQVIDNRRPQTQPAQESAS